MDGTRHRVRFGSEEAAGLIAAQGLTTRKTARHPAVTVVSQASRCPARQVPFRGSPARTRTQGDDFDAGTPAATVTAAMQQKGREELSYARRFIGFDGEVTQRTQYKYGIDYQLGDLVEMRGKDGISAVVRVTEQIFTSDAEGDKSYPTLSNKLTAEPGSWASMGNAEWIDYDDDLTTYWSSMP